MSAPAARLPRVHVVTDDDVVGAASFAARAAEVLDAGDPAVALHLRHRGDGGALYALAAELAGRARRSGATLIVNRRADVALAAGADGVHLGRGAIGAGDARSVMGARAWLGVSTHVQAEVADAAADYVIFGPVYATASHPSHEPAGLEVLAEVAARPGPPVLAIGGVDAARAAECARAGAYGVAVLRAVWAAPRPGRATRRLTEILEMLE